VALRRTGAFEPLVEEDAEVGLDDAHPARSGKGLALVLCAGLLLRCSYLAAFLSNPILRDYLVLDSKAYLALGSRLVAGELDREVFSSSPLYIWLVGHTCYDGTNGTVFLIALQQVLGLATAACVFVTGRQLFGQVAGLTGSVLYLLYGSEALLEVKLLPSVPATFLATLGLCLCIWPVQEFNTKRRAAVRGLAGISLGLSALCKADLLLMLPLAATGAWWFQRASNKSNIVVTSACVLGFCAAVFPATLHNLRAGEFVPISSQGGLTFFHGNNPRAEGTFSLPEGFSGNKANQQRESQDLAKRALGRDLSVREVDSYWYGRGIEYLKASPLGALHLLGRKLVYWLSSNELSAEYTVSVEREVTWAIWLFPVPFGLLLALGTIRLLRRKDAMPVGVWGVVVMIVVNVAATMVFYCSSR
jgi:4-amino-4-deoxy-L-arabinose transferase-like glycosyltransferase